MAIRACARDRFRRFRPHNALPGDKAPAPVARIGDFVGHAIATALDDDRTGVVFNQGDERPRLFGACPRRHSGGKRQNPPHEEKWHHPAHETTLRASAQRVNANPYPQASLVSEPLTNFVTAPPCQYRTRPPC